MRLKRFVLHHSELLRANASQEGQDGVDQGGWSFAVDDLSSKGARIYLTPVVHPLALQLLTGDMMPVEC